MLLIDPENAVQTLGTPEWSGAVVPRGTGQLAPIHGMLSAPSAITDPSNGTDWYSSWSTEARSKITFVSEACVTLRSSDSLIAGPKITAPLELYVTFISSEMGQERDDTGLRFLLAAIYRLDARDPAEAVDRVVDELDDRLCVGRFSEVDDLLFQASPSKLSAATIVSMLGVTLAAKPRLPARAILYGRALAAIAAQRGSISAAEKLLAKYR